MSAKNNSTSNCTHTIHHEYECVHNIVVMVNVASCWPNVVSASNSYVPSWKAASDPPSQEIYHVNVSQKLAFCVLENRSLESVESSPDFYLTSTILLSSCLSLGLHSSLFSYFSLKCVCFFKCFHSPLPPSPPSLPPFLPSLYSLHPF